MGRLHDQLREDLLLKAYSPHTLRAYLGCVRQFVRYYMRSPQDMGEQEVRGFLLHLVRDRKASTATQDMYVNALKFLYTVTLKRSEVVKDISHPKRPHTPPVILSPEEVLRIFEAIRSVKYKAIIATAYAAGLRVSEVCGLYITDIDSQRMRIRVRSGKGKKDRYVMLGESLLSLLRQYYQAARPKGEYLFPGHKPQRHITTTAVNKVLRQVISETGLSKRVTMHTLRHCFATHLLEAGIDIRILQVLLGHSSIRTTLRYTHITDRLVQRLVSPLDMIQPVS
ncbi:MAG: site-specific tyrosine recombinase/integron integrase [Desulfobacteraceae bacterium]